MELQNLLIIIAVIAIVMTFLIGFVMKKKESWLMSFLQNYVGVFFIVSGIVKAIDPLGTAYKTGDYLGEFFIAFDGSFLKPLAGIFTFMNEYTIFLSVAMIVFEIILGIMLIMGHRPKLTAWLFLLLMAAFTIMTGFTYLTGYVSDEINFFEFSKWGPYLESNRKVTDCGCFGDFMKLEPIVTFFKDVILLIPGLYFLFKSKLEHKLFSKKTRDIITGLSIVGLSLFCFSNYVWDIPNVDFRPFKKGVDMLAQKQLEEDAMANVSILSWTLKNRTSEETLIMTHADYMSDYKSYPKKDWEIIDQAKTKPTIKSTKISEFELSNPEDGGDSAEEVLSNPDAKFLIVCYELKGEVVMKSRTVTDSLFEQTVVQTNTGQDSTVISFVKLVEKEVSYATYHWDKAYLETFKNTIKPLAEASKKDGIEIHLAVGGADFDMIQAFINEIGTDMKYYSVDELILKTIVRSNPGVVLLKESTILDKWHYKKLPSYDSIKSNYKL